MKRYVSFVVALALTMGACGDDSETSDSPGTSTSGQAATGAPIKVGWVNAEGGAVSFPDLRIGAEVGVKHVNSKRNGIKGRPIELVRCDTDGSPEKSIDCANRFVEAKVAFVHEGVDPAGDAMLPILAPAKIPLVGRGAVGPGRQVSDNAFYLGLPTPALAVAPLEFFKSKGKKSMTVLYMDIPPAHAFADNLMPKASASAGMKHTPVFFNPMSPDFSVATTTALKSKPDAISMSGAEPHCAGFLQALRAAGYQGDIFAASCVEFIKTAGAAAEGVYTYSDLWRPDDPESAPPAKRKDIEEYVQAMKDAGQSAKANGLAYAWFADVVNFARIVSTVEGTVDGPAVSAAIKKTVDFDMFLGTTVTCDGSVWKGENGCNDTVLVYQVKDGVLRATSSTFLDLSAHAPK